MAGLDHHGSSPVAGLPVYFECTCSVEVSDDKDGTRSAETPVLFLPTRA